MTTRFSLAELADMLGAPLPAVRSAVETLAARGELTAESFAFAGQGWRIAPSDVKRVQELVRSWADTDASAVPGRRIRAKRVVTPRDLDSAEERGGEHP